jgi:type VI protein secretion system component Hcp
MPIAVRHILTVASAAAALSVFVVAMPFGISAQAQRLGVIQATSASPLPPPARGTLTIRRARDGLSPSLQAAQQAGTVFPQLVIRIPSSKSHPYLELRLYSVKVTSYSVNGSGLDETVSLNFDKVQ